MRFLLRAIRFMRISMPVSQPQHKMQDQIKSALAEAKASAVMITENIFSESGPEYIAAITAIANADYRPSPEAKIIAENLSLAFLVACPDVAMAAINQRIAARAAKEPISEAAQRALAGQD